MRFALVLFSTVGVILSVAVIAGVVGKRPSDGLTMSETTLNYACGYRAGQMAIMRQLQKEFQNSITTEDSMCAERRHSAVKGGFTIAGEP